MGRSCIAQSKWERLYYFHERGKEKMLGHVQPDMMGCTTVVQLSI
jgi:hypothetical protein